MVTPMKKIVSILVFFLAVLIFIPPAQARLEATVDRNQLAVDETFNLTLTRDGGSVFSSVDLKPLTRDFKIIGRSQGSSTRIVNGNRTSSFTLNLTLAPKHSGNLRIPPLTVGGESSQPLTVKMVTMAQPKTRADNAPIFIETSVDKKTALVQEQVILSLRIYWAVNAEINEPKAPSLSDAMLEKLKDATYSKVINGRNYKVFERKYAIFPQKAGVMEIPPLTVRATLPSRQQRPDIFPDIFDDFFRAQGRQITLHSKQEKITVKKKAPGYPAGAVWLPTGKLSVAVDWSRKPAELKVGESTTVNITLAGQGLLASQLPPVKLPEMSGIKLYQGKAEVKNLKNDSGVTGLRKESVALIPTRPGTATMPDIRIPWWNKDRDRLEYLTIPSRKLVIKGAGSISSSAGEDSPPAVPQTKVAGETATRLAPITKTPTSSKLPRKSWWLVACGILVLAWLITLAMLFKTRSRYRP